MNAKFPRSKTTGELLAEKDARIAELERQLAQRCGGGKSAREEPDMTQRGAPKPTVPADE